VTSQPLKLAFLASRNGTSARAMIAAIKAGELPAEARLMVSNNKGAGALVHAAEEGVETLCLPTQSDPAGADAKLCAALEAAGVDLVILSGYLRRLGPKTLERFAGRVLNIHPGPLPAFGGEGMYGRKVHEAVIASGASESGVAIHVVDEEYDHGPVIAQRPVPVLPGDDATALEARVTSVEPAFYLETVKAIATGALRLP
jgi:phosphoribosylglycinamide formyltransferase-1